MFSVIICSNRPERSALARGHYENLFSGRPFEVILIPDAVSLCEGYARGVAASRGDRLVFSHDDVEFVTPDAAARIERHLQTYDLIGVAGTTRLVDGTWYGAGDPYCFALVVYPTSDGRYSIRCAGRGPLCVEHAQALDGCFFACRREVAERVEFDSATFDGFHLYDLDFTFRAYRSGFRLAICRDLALIHASMGEPGEAFDRYRRRFEAKHADALAPGGAVAQPQTLSATFDRPQLAELLSPDVLARALRPS